MITSIKKFIKNILTSETILPIFWSIYASSQNKNIENKLLKKYAEKLKIDKSFIEFGFHVFEYNCVELTKLNYKGLLIDADKKNCKRSNLIFKKLKLKTKAKSSWIKINSLDPIIEFVKNNNDKLGILSIDIDGNDYWILKEIYSFVKPEIIITEYNASFLDKSISVPYHDNFERHSFHKSGFYHGASINAFYKLLSEDYFLIESIGGNNLIFLRKDKLKNDIKTLTPNKANKEPLLRNKWSGKKAKEQWEEIKCLDYIEI